MSWKKLGCIYNIYQESDQRWSHASNPTPFFINDKLFIYYSVRNKAGKASIFVFELFIDGEDWMIIEHNKEPLVTPGPRGFFDSHGCTSSVCVEVENEIYLYYLGWELSPDVPFQNSIGVVKLTEGGLNAKKIFQGPLLDRNIHDHLSLSYPFILNDSGLYRMWYGTNKKWGEEKLDMNYCFRYAESMDGINWKRYGKIALDTDPKTNAFARPWVIINRQTYQLYYSFRGPQQPNFLIGYAESKDGFLWQRKDHLSGLKRGSEGAFDDQMLCYPAIFDHQGHRYMLYNGNGYGKTGIGLAILEQN